MKPGRWDDWPFVQKVIADLDRALAMECPEPDAEGVYHWEIGGRDWTARKFTDPNGLEQTPRCPGIYIDSAGSPHFNVPELCAIVELEPTPENQKSVVTILRGAAKMGDVAVIVDPKLRLM